MLLRRDFLSALAAAPALQAQEEGFTPLEQWTVVDGPESAFTVSGAEIAVHLHASLPCWLRSAREYENFELRGEFFIRGWTDSGIYLHAPEHGRPSQAGMQIKVFHQKEDKPAPWSAGAIFPAIAPKLVNVREGWNELRVLCDWPRLQVWSNGVMIHDLNLETHPELRRRLRSGFIGIVGASVDCRFRNLRVRELPSKLRWVTLYESPADFAKWAVSQGKPNFQAMGGVLRADGAGHLAFQPRRFRDFYLQLYIRGCPQHNGGVLFRTGGHGTATLRDYEIQLHNVEEAHFPTGSLYHIQRARYPRIEDGRWFLFELWAQGRDVAVRIDGDTVMEYSGVENIDEGFIELQAHREGYWLEFKRIRLLPL